MLKNPWVIIGIIAVVLIGGSVWYSGKAAERNNAGVDTSLVHSKGNPDAAVVLVEYSDFQCPACASFQPILTDIMNEFGDGLRFEYKHFPLPIHPFAVQAGVAAEAAAQQGKFFEYHDALFENQTAWSASPNPTGFFFTYAEEVGLDMDQFKRQMRSTLLRDKVMAQRTEATGLGLTGTPTFFLNGQRMSFTTFEEFYNQIAVAVDPARAEAATAEGQVLTVPPAQAEPAVRFGI